MIKLIAGQNGLDQFKTATPNSEVNIPFMCALENTDIKCTKKAYNHLNARNGH